MKKLIHLFSFFIAFLLGGIFYTLSVKASPAPTLDASMFNVVTTTASDFFQLGLVPQGLSPYTDDLLTVWNPWNAGGALLSFDINDCEIEELTTQQKTTLLDSYSIIDSSNLSVTVNSPIYSVHFDNGYFDGYAYVDDQGKLLSYTNDLGGHLLQLKYGGSIKSTADWEQLLNSTATQIYSANNNLFVSQTPSDLTEYSYYIMWGVTGSGRPADAYGIFIPNQYQKGVIVPTNSNNGTVISSWFCNGSPYVIEHVYGTSTNQRVTITSGTYSKDGVSYTKKITFTTNNLTIGVNTTPNNTYENWVQGINASNRLLALQGHVYNSTLNNQTESIAFKPIQLPESAEIINYNYYYDPTEIARLEQEINNLTQTVNSNYNNQQSISENNFPFYYPLNDPQTSPSQIPFPNVQNYPGFNPFPSNVPSSDPSVNPSIENLEQQIDPTGITNNIPIISGLQNKFPFSIPWDIYNLVKGLSVPREIPVLEWEIEIPIIDYTWTPTIDLTMYDSTATLFRTLFLITFIIGLAVFSYNHFFGQ